MERLGALRITSPTMSACSRLTPDRRSTATEYDHQELRARGTTQEARFVLTVDDEWQRPLGGIAGNRRSSRLPFEKPFGEPFRKSLSDRHHFRRSQSGSIAP
jgi:hypothetical protein